MLHFVLLQAMGDNLISLSFLNQVSKELSIVGTKHTKKISDLIDSQWSGSIDVLYDDIPAFYDFKKSNFADVIKDIITFRRYLKSKGVKSVVFEKKDIRTLLLTYGLGIKVISSNNIFNAYENRCHLISTALNEKIEIKKCESEYSNIRVVLISPTTRVKEKNILHPDLKVIIDSLKERGFIIQLIDFDKSYSNFVDEVDEYFTNTTLLDVKNLIINCDLFIGADSFLIHLAYFYNKAFFIIFNKENTSFLPPSCISIENYVLAPLSHDFKGNLIDKFKKIGLIRE